MAELIALLLAGLTGMLGPGSSEAELAAALEERLRTTEAVVFEEVEVSCSGIAGGRVESLTLDLTGLLLDPLVIDDARITVHGLALSGGRITLKDIEWQASISDSALTGALASQATELGDSRISISKKALSLSGTYPFMGARLPYNVAGQLSVEKGTQLMFRIENSDAGGIGLPAQLNRMVEGEINPVYDLAEFARRSQKDIRRAREQFSYEFELEVGSISNAEGHIIVSGKA